MITTNSETGTTTEVYGSPALGQCLRMFEPTLNKAIVSVECLEIVFLVLISFFWWRAQRRIPSQFAVLKWHNFGMAMPFWLIYVIIIFAQFFLDQCTWDFHLEKSYRMTIAGHVFQWIALNFTLATVLLAIPHGLDRLRDPDSADNRKSMWTLVARAVVALIAIFTIIYLCLYIWALQTANTNENDWAWLLSDSTEPSAFPQHIYVNMALLTCWFLAILAAIAKMALNFRAATRSWNHVPTSLKAWMFTLCGALFAYGFLMTFYSFYDNLALFTIESFLKTYTTHDVCELVLTTFFLLLSLLAIVQIASKVSSILTHPELYDFGTKEEVGTNDNIED